MTPLFILHSLYDVTAYPSSVRHSCVGGRIISFHGRVGDRVLGQLERGHKHPLDQKGRHPQPQADDGIEQNHDQGFVPAKFV